MHRLRLPALSAPAGAGVTPSELTGALALLGRVVAAHSSEEERAEALGVLREIRRLLRDVRNSEDDVFIGRQASVIKPSLTLMKLQCVAPPQGLEGILRWVEDQAGTRGRRELTPCGLVTEDGEWTELSLPNKPQDAGFRVYRREARRAPTGGGLDVEPPEGVPSGPT